MRILTLLFAIAFFAACGNGEVSSDASLEAMEAARVAQEAAYEGMNEAHDRIMPRMGEITAAQRAIKEQLEMDGLAEDKKELLEAAYEQLEDANDGMMEWMQGMKPLEELRETMDNDAIITYIREESADIADVETAINSSVAMAKELVGDHSGHSHDGHDHDGHDHSGHNH
ncbi:hypothetical protein [Lewinella sp. 4G2]|uniref:hypothetical protein n=1 Tax=Lewinella sp. 4G2 TaxID=1803372 RepID=UPI0007B4F3C8|nr:hypothetical protein [Lewinella sp. 4G2]OAV42819.1 hypothetical protein A3850_016435 [Lewinella sp. 4G2]